MADYRWNPDEFGRVLALPAAIAEQHLKLAGPIQLKVLLWFATNGTFDAEACARAVGYSPSDCADAMRYWTAAGLLLDGGTAPVPQKTAVAPAPRPKAVKPQMKEVIAAQKSSPEFTYLLDAVSARLGKPLSPGDMETLLYLFTTAGLPAEVILMAVGYAAQSERFTVRYIEKIALDWADKGILTIAAAEEHLCRLERCQQALLKVQTVCGLSKPLNATAGNLDMAEKWVFAWHTGDELLRLAAEISVEKTGKFEMPYVNRILENWRGQGVTSADEVRGRLTKKADREESDYEQMVELYVPKYNKKKKG